MRQSRRIRLPLFAAAVIISLLTCPRPCAALEQELRAALGTKVKITQNSRGGGKLVIHFGNHREFERLREQLSGPTATSKAG